MSFLHDVCVFFWFSSLFLYLRNRLCETFFLFSVFCFLFCIGDLWERALLYFTVDRFTARNHKSENILPIRCLIFVQEPRYIFRGD